MPAGASRRVHRLAVLGNHPPRLCGIATFTQHLTDALVAERNGLECAVLAMNDPGNRYAYPARVRFEIGEADLTSYRRAVDFLHVHSPDVVSLQHEYGIFGGDAGAHVLALLRELRVPVVTTLHTVLATPDPQQRLAMDGVIRASERLVVMSARGAALLGEVHHVPADKIDLIPHGIPDVPPNLQGKEALGLQDRPVILTFGLLSPDKGIEQVIDALPAILARHPSLIYVVLGATHPTVKAHHGEAYRDSLEARARHLGVEHAVRFDNRFVSEGELVEYLGAADLYITPYHNAQQITSGTLAYAVGAGKAVISTPYLYAEELLADGRGVLVPWRDPPAIAREVVALLDDEPARLAMCARARAHGRAMQWPEVARGYLESFDRARHDHATRTPRLLPKHARRGPPIELPVLDLRHLRHMTDATGLLQHASFCVPRYDEGYCTDDNARALLLVTGLEASGPVGATRELASRYLAFVSHAFDSSSGRFRNFLSYERQWTETVGSEDSHGRALWALGAVGASAADDGRRKLGKDLFRAALPAARAFSSPRAWAFSLLGLDDHLKASPLDASAQAVRTELAERLLGLFERSSAPDWPWFEESATYDNARLSQALIVSGARMRRPQMLRSGLRSLAWLAEVQRCTSGWFAPIGSNGFYVRGGIPAEFDQQPVEACAMVSACLEACRVTGEPRWAAHARSAFRWFLGQNQLEMPLYDASTGGCRDGLHADRVNENQGAESMLSFLLALEEMRGADRARLRAASTHRAALLALTT